VGKSLGEFENNIVDIFGAAGREWLLKLPDLLEKFKAKWNLREVIPFPNLTYSFVGTTLSGSAPAVLKVMPVCSRFLRECEWYRMQGGCGSPALLDYDEHLGGLLIEEVKPASSVKDLVLRGDDRGATCAIADAILGLQHRLADKDTSFPHVRDFSGNLNRLQNYVPEKMLSGAKSLLQALSQSGPEDVILHGDLHHDNVLKLADGWVAIDPHGYIGPGAFEVGAMMRNPYDCFPAHSSLKSVIMSRVELLARKLSYTPGEIQAWSLIYTLVSASWSLEDHGEVPDEHMEIARVLEALIR